MKKLLGVVVAGMLLFPSISHALYSSYDFHQYTGYLAELNTDDKEYNELRDLWHEDCVIPGERYVAEYNGTRDGAGLTMSQKSSALTSINLQYEEEDKRCMATTVRLYPEYDRVKNTPEEPKKVECDEGLVYDESRGNCQFAKESVKGESTTDIEAMKKQIMELTLIVLQLQQQLMARLQN